MRRCLSFPTVRAWIGLNLYGDRNKRRICFSELVGFIKCEEFLDELRNWQLFNKDFALWSYSALCVVEE